MQFGGVALATAVWTGVFVDTRGPMRSLFLPILLKDTFAEHPELRAKIVAHFGISDWKMSQWMAGTKKPDPITRMKLNDYISVLLRRKRGDDLA